MNKQKVKIYVYHVKDDFIKDFKLEIYAIDKKQANQLIELYKKKNKDNIIEYIKISKNKDSINKLNYLINKFGSVENLINEEFELFKKRGIR